MNMPHHCLVGPIQYPDDPAGLAASHPVLWAMLLEKCPCVESKVPLLAAAALKAAQPCRVSKTGCGGSDKSQSTQHQLARLGGPLLGGPPNKIPKTLVNFLENMANPHHQQPQQPSATITFGNGRLRNSDGRSWLYGWSALDQPCRASDQPCFMVDRLFGAMVDSGLDFGTTRSVTGRFWADHSNDLGCPPKLYWVQGAGFINGSWVDSNIAILMKTIENAFIMMVVIEIDIYVKKRHGCTTTQNLRVGMHQHLEPGWDCWRDPDKASRSGQPWLMVDRPFEHLDQPSLIFESGNGETLNLGGSGGHPGQLQGQLRGQLQGQLQDQPQGQLQGQLQVRAPRAPATPVGAPKFFPAGLLAMALEDKPAETEPAETQLADTPETQPAESQPAETPPAETQLAETQPAETQPAEAPLESFVAQFKAKMACLPPKLTKKQAKKQAKAKTAKVIWISMGTLIVFLWSFDPGPKTIY
jgi:hypothetical protein